LLKAKLLEHLSVSTPPRWTSAIQCQADQLYAEIARHPNPKKSTEILDRLTSDPLMERVWRELFKKDRQSGVFFYPAVTPAMRAARLQRLAAELRSKGGAKNEGEAERLELAAEVEHMEDGIGEDGEEEDDEQDDNILWHAQTFAAQVLLRKAFLEAIDIKPVFLGELEDKVSTLNCIGQRLETDGRTLESFGMRQEAKVLRRIVRACKEEAENILPDRRNDESAGESLTFRSRRDDPWVLTRRSKDDELRTYIVCLALTALSLFGKTLDGTLANIATVVFGREVTRATVREALRNQSLR
jgi:hypothetical protein